MKSIVRTISYAVSALLALTLVACGGGGGSGSGSPAATTFTWPSTLVTSVPAPTYAAASQELAAFNLLNDERSCDFAGRL